MRIKQKAVFLDRDGTLIKYKPLLTDVKEVELEDTVCSAINMITRLLLSKSVSSF